MAKKKISESDLPEAYADDSLHLITKKNLSDDFLADKDTGKLYINFPEPTEKELETTTSSEGTTVSFGGKGTEAEPLKADVKLSTNDGNALVKGTDGGLYVPKPAAQNCIAIRDIFDTKLGADGNDIKVVLCSES